MAPNNPESWGFQGLAGLVRDLGPTEGERKVYKKVKELYQRATKMSAGEPPDEWRPPGQNQLTRKEQSSWHPDQELRNLASDSLEATLNLRHRPTITKPSDREKECHAKLLNLAIKMGDIMKLQEQQVRIDAAYGDLQMQAHLVTKRMDTWTNAVSAPDCSLHGPGHKDDQKQRKYNWEPDHLIRAYHTTTSSPKAIALVE